MMRQLCKLRRLAVFLAMSALSGVVLSACGVQEDSSPRSLGVSGIALARDASPSEAEPVSPDPSDEFLIIYFVRGQDDFKISEVLRFAPQPMAPEDIVDFLLEGPSEEEIEQGFVSYLPRPDDLLGTRVDGDVLVLNFRKGSRLEDLSGLQFYLAAGQLVLSLVGDSSPEGVRVEIEGSPIALPSEEGDLLRPARREDYDDLIDDLTEIQSFTFEDLLRTPPPFPPAPEAEELPDGAYTGEDMPGSEDIGREIPDS